MKHCSNAECSHLERFGRVSEFLDTVEDCPDCGAPLVDGEAPEVPEPTYRDLVTVYELSSDADAQLARAKLEANGLFVHVAGSRLQGAMGELPPTMLSLRVQVEREQAEWARKILGFDAAGGPDDA